MQVQDTMTSNRDDAIIPSWDGEPAGWAEYSRRVRLCYQQLPSYKRYTLAPKLVLKLKGKAWEIASSINYEELETETGTQYLLSFLRSRLGRLPIPDVGQHLDELFVRCRRTPGTDMISWCNQVREAYKKVQRSLARTRASKVHVATQTEETGVQTAGTADGSSPSSVARRRLSGSEPHREPQQEATDGLPSQGLHGETVEEEQEAQPHEQRDDWNWSSWRYNGWQDWSDWKTGGWDSPSSRDYHWEDDETSFQDIIPEEVLGWLLMRRSGLPSAAKLAIQASSGNSMRFSDVEKAMRQQEDELMAQERQRGVQRAQRTYWVENQGQWGIFLTDLDDRQDEDDQIHWVDPSSMGDQWGAQDESETDHSPQIMLSDGFEWHWYDDEWHTMTAGGEWVAFSDMKPWLEIDEVACTDPQSAKELQELFVAFDSKVRSFKESRNAVYQKGKNRGFYKGGKSKGKGSHQKGKKGSGSPVLAVQGFNQGSKGSFSGNPKSGTPGMPGYSGCFICGDKGHDFRNCPKRGQSTSSANRSSSSRALMIGMVEDADPGSPVAMSPPAGDLRRLILAADTLDVNLRLSHAVVDTGATETVGSLEAVEVRSQRFGQERVGLDVRRKKRFNFGNAQEREAESYLLLPQTVQGVSTSLGVYTLDVPGVPILIGIRTLSRLGAVVDVSKPALVFRKTFPGVEIPLIRGSNGHLLLDLCKDWCDQQTYGSAKTHDAMENPDIKGAHERQDEGLIHDIEVVELSSDESNHPDQATCVHIEDPMLALSAQEFTHPTTPDCAHPESHAVLREDLRPQDVPEREISHLQGHDTRGHQGCIQEQDEFGTLRLGQSSGVRPEGPPCNGVPVSVPTRSRPIPPGEPIGIQRPRGLDHMPNVLPPPGVCPDLRVHGHLQKPRSLSGRHNEEARRASQFDGRGAHHQGNWLGCCGGLSHEESGEDPQGEAGVGGGQGQVYGIPERAWQEGGAVRGPDGPQHGDCGQEDTEARPSSTRRSTRARDDSEAVGPSGWRVVDGDSLNVPSDIPDLTKEALLSLEETDACNCQGFLTEDQRAHIKESLRGAGEELMEALMSCSENTVYKCDLVEVCCGPESGITRIINEKGGKAFRIGLENDMDLTTTHGFERALEFLRIVRPRWLWVSPTCGPTSPLQRLNQKTEIQRKRLKQKVRKSKKLASRVVQMCEQHVSEGGHLAWEWPRYNTGWTFPHVHNFFQSLSQEGILWVAKLDGCMVDIRTPDTGELMKKPWCIKTTNKHMYHALNIQCNGEHVHVPCEGHGRPKSTAFYSEKMCRLIARTVLESSQHASIVGGSRVLEEAYALEGIELPPWSEKELKEKKDIIRKLHVRAGHPTGRALHNLLKARGVDPRFLPLALSHDCDECREIRLPVPHRNVSLHTTEVLWHTLQIDVGQIPLKDLTLHVLFCVDEASRFAVAWELFRCEKQEHRNATSEEVVHALERCWVQYHGWPNCIRCDPEGAFRGQLFSDWAATRGINIEPCPAEDHGQIGIVEATIGKLKEDVRALLRTEDIDPFSAVIHVVNAHNEADRIGGYAPAQWAYGRLPGLDGRLFEGGHGIPVHSSEGTTGTDLRANLQIRVKAEEQYRKSQAVMKINRAMKSQVRPHQVFLPGDLVYYKRFKTPMNQTTSHPGVDIPKVSLSRWFGPARVLATETRTETDPPSKRPGSVVWIVAAGRLKRCSPHQLRHCSEKEKLLAEASEALTMPWSFSSLLQMVERGQYQVFDDLERDEREPQFREREAAGAQQMPDFSRRVRSRSVPANRARKETEKQTRPHKDPEPRKAGTPSGSGAAPQTPTAKDPKRGQSVGVERRHDHAKRPTSTAPVGSASKAPRSHGDMTLSELLKHPPFQRAVERSSDKKSIPGASSADLVEEIFNNTTADQPDWELEDALPICALEVSLPESKKELTRFTRDSETWVSRKIKKGTEIKWSQIPKDRIPDFRKAMDKEVSHWIKEGAIRLVKEQVPPSRVLKMRWVYTIKRQLSQGTPGHHRLPGPRFGEFDYNQSNDE